MQQQVSSSDVTVWLRFFKDASIQPHFAQTYANKFIENRIRFDMLNDLDRPLLNEMGINAIGDCLSILKHAKLIHRKIEEKNKELLILSSLNDSNAGVKKRNEVAKRIIETYLSDPEAKPLNEKTTLSADLMSRLNLKSTSPVAAQPPAAKLLTKVTFNEDSLNQIGFNSASKVSSTTNDDDLNERRKLKRKLNQKDEDELEYRGLLKSSPEPNKTNNVPKVEPNKRLSLNFKKLTVDESGRRSLQPAEPKEPRTIIRSGLVSDFETKPESVFNRISLTNPSQEETVKKATKPVHDSVAVTRRLLGEFGKKEDPEPTRSVKIETIVKKAKLGTVIVENKQANIKQRIMPIKFGASTETKPKPSITLKRNRAIQEVPVKKSLQSRISF